MNDPRIFATFYLFVAWPEFASFRAPILARCVETGVRGTILLAEEGINGTISGDANAVRSVLSTLRAIPALTTLPHRESPAGDRTFHRMKVRLKREIVTMGRPEARPAERTGKVVSPDVWNALIDDPDVVVIDARNEYEVAIGSFEGAIDPHTTCFRDLPKWLENEPRLRHRPKVAMYCTGGIRCEKSTAYLRALGFEEVYQLKGGILRYLETVPESESRWRGECFVFDERVAVGHGFRRGTYELCRACRRPLSHRDRESELYECGVSCAYCHELTTNEQKRRYAERQRQIELADARGTTHIG